MSDPRPPLSTPPRALPANLTSLRSRRSPLADPARQLATLNEVDLGKTPSRGDFGAALAAAGYPTLQPTQPEVLQLNLGKLCNMTCRHCHVDAGPDRSDEVMDRRTADACLAMLAKTPVHTVDLTGGAPELNPHFRYLVEESRRLGRHVLDRCNLTVLLLPRHHDLPHWLAEHRVEVVASLPHPRRPLADAQRGASAWERSIEALRRLNAVGYGSGDPHRRLTLVANPTGAFLSGSQSGMEREWKAVLARESGVRFDRLITLTNMPIARYLEWLESSGNLQRYMELLVTSWNEATVPGLMCRSTISVSWDGRIFDCDFNQMLELEIHGDDDAPMTVFNFDLGTWRRRTIRTDRHCFGCTAGCGSSCGGALAD